MEDKIKYYHYLLFEYLYSKHEEDNNFLFQMRKTNQRQMLTNGFWFNGLSAYLETSFWEYRNDIQLFPTPTIRLCFNHEDENWVLELVSREDKRQEYFEKMANALGSFEKDNARNVVWRKKIIAKGFINGIEQLIAEDKTQIDEYLKNNPPDPQIKVGFINYNDFKKQIENINRFKDKKLSLAVRKHLEFSNDFNPCFTTIYIENYQGIREASIHFDNDTNFLFLTGDNGAGKTSLLRAIAKSFLGDEEKVEQIKENTNISIVSPKNLYAVKKGVSRIANVLGYGIVRFAVAESENYGQAYSLFDIDGRLLSIESILKDASPAIFDKIKKVLLAIVPDISDIKKEYVNGFSTISYVEKSEIGEKNYEQVSLKNLAAGYRGIVTMIGDMIRRFNATLEKNFKDIEGIVIIDEFDAHLHPKYQYELPKLLSEVFPKVLFILSTHSPIPLLGVPENKKMVVYKVNRTPETGITAERLDDDIDIERLSANALLSSEIFGFKNIFARGATPEIIIPSNNYADLSKEKRQELLKKRFNELNLKKDL